MDTDKLKKMIMASIPSDEEMKVRTDARVKEAEVNPMAFENWYADVVSLGISTPESIIIPFSYDVQGAFIDKPDSFDSLCHLNRLYDQIMMAAVKLGYPLFMKNSLFSAKHYWLDTCVILETDSKEEVFNKILRMNDQWMMVGSDIALNLVLRKFIETEPLFHAFYGLMPITREFRVFANGGQPYAYQFYWPKESILDPDDDNWAEKLQEASKIMNSDLKIILDMASKVTDDLGGDWSVDFLMDKHGKWHLIDMAIADRSYTSPDIIRL